MLRRKRRALERAGDRHIRRQFTLDTRYLHQQSRLGCPCDPAKPSKDNLREEADAYGVELEGRGTSEEGARMTES